MKSTPYSFSVHHERPLLHVPECPSRWKLQLRPQVDFRTILANLFSTDQESNTEVTGPPVLVSQDSEQDQWPQQEHDQSWVLPRQVTHLARPTILSQRRRPCWAWDRADQVLSGQRGPVFLSAPSLTPRKVGPSPGSTPTGLSSLPRVAASPGGPPTAIRKAEGIMEPPCIQQGEGSGVAYRSLLLGCSDAKHQDGCDQSVSPWDILCVHPYLQSCPPCGMFPAVEICNVFMHYRSPGPSTGLGTEEELHACVE